MKSVIYIYTRTGVTPILQIFDAMNLSMNAKTKEASTASFNIPLYLSDGTIHPALKDTSFLTGMNRVKIGLITGSTESIEFEGYISGVSDGSISTQVSLSDNLGILESRFISADVTFTTQTISAILTSIFATMNGIDATGLTVSSSVTDTVTKTYTSGQRIIDIISDLAQGGYEYVMKGRTLYFGTVVGTDLSTGEGFVEFRYDSGESIGRTISEFTMESNTKNILNAIGAKSSGGVLSSASDAPSITLYGRREEMISANDGNIGSEVTKYLAEHKDNTVEVSVTPMSYNYSLADPGDKVKVYIDRGDARGIFDGTMTVVSKEFSIQGDLPTVVFSLSNSKIRTPNILEKLKKMNEDINNLKTL